MKPAVFLDRDGTINVDKDYLYRIEDFEYLNGVEEALRQLERSGFLLVIVTNQSGIARGYYIENDYRHLMDWMISDLSGKGIHIAGDYFCPHLPGAVVKKYDVECDCRKPKTGLYYRAAKELDIDMEKSFSIGDKLRVLEICRETGVKGILIGDKNRDSGDHYHVCRNWKEISEYFSRL